MMQQEKSRADEITGKKGEAWRVGLADGADAWRRIVSTAALSGVPAPGFSAALAYYDSLTAPRLPAALIQGQRDFFGAHTYKRIDRDGIFHTMWGDDRREVGPAARRP